MSCLTWNCRGLRNPLAEDDLEAIIQAQDPLIVFLSKTWSGRKQLEKIRCKIKYAGLFYIPSQGRGGRLAHLWKLDITVWIDSFSRCHIDVVVNETTMEPGRFTGFYREPSTYYREEAWSMLRML